MFPGEVTYIPRTEVTLLTDTWRVLLSTVFFVSSTHWVLQYLKLSVATKKHWKFSVLYSVISLLWNIFIGYNSGHAYLFGEGFWIILAVSRTGWHRSQNRGDIICRHLTGTATFWLLSVTMFGGFWMRLRCFWEGWHRSKNRGDVVCRHPTPVSTCCLMFLLSPISK